MRTWPDDFVNHIIQGDCLEVLREMPDDVIHACVTSPPYWGLRKYGDHDNLPFIGLEKTPEQWLEKIVLVFREVRRVMRPDGVLWMNLGDTYSANRGYQVPDRKWENVGNDAGSKTPEGMNAGEPVNLPHKCAEALRQDGWHWRDTIIWHKPGPKPESVNGVRWERCRVKVKSARSRSASMDSETGNTNENSAYTTGKTIWQDCPGCPKCEKNDGWVLRRGQWRTTRAHEYVFLMTKTDEYFCDREAAAEQGKGDRGSGFCDERDMLTKNRLGTGERNHDQSKRNPRSVWSITSEPLKFKHYAAFPTALVRKCLLPSLGQKYCQKCGTPWARMMKRQESPHTGRTESGYEDGMTAKRLALLRQAAREQGAEYQNESTTIGFRPTCACEGNDGSGRPIVLDPFAGTGTTCLVAQKMSADYVGIELSTDYIKNIAHNRTSQKMLV